MNDLQQVLQPTFNRPATSVHTCVRKRRIRSASGLKTCASVTCATAFASHAPAPGLPTRVRTTGRHTHLANDPAKVAASRIESDCLALPVDTNHGRNQGVASGRT